MSRRLEDLSGRRFGHLTVIRRAGSYRTKAYSDPLWLCVCDCGTEFVVRGCNLRSGRTRSCGNGRAGRRIMVTEQLSEKDADIIKAMARNGMRVTEAARSIGSKPSAEYKRLDGIEERTGLNPRDFYDLAELIRMIGGDTA